VGDYGGLLRELQRLGTVKVAAAVILFYLVSVALSRVLPEPASVWGVPSGWWGIGISAGSAWLLVSLGDLLFRMHRDQRAKKAKLIAEEAARLAKEDELRAQFKLDPDEQELLRVLFIEPGRKHVHVETLRDLEAQRPGMMDAANRLLNRDYLIFNSDDQPLTLRSKVFAHFSARPDFVGSDAPRRSNALDRT